MDLHDLLWTKRFVKAGADQISRLKRQIREKQRLGRDIRADAFALAALRIVQADNLAAQRMLRSRSVRRSHTEFNHADLAGARGGPGERPAASPQM